MGVPAVVLVFVNLPYSTCGPVLSVFVGSKHHVVTKIKAAVPAFSILRKENVIFSHIMLLLYPRKKPKTRTSPTPKKLNN